MFLFVALLTVPVVAERAIEDLETRWGFTGYMKHVAAVQEHIPADVLIEKAQIAGGSFGQCETLKNVVNCDAFEPQHLGTGSFGEAWLVETREEEGKKVVMKFLVNVVKGNGSRLHQSDLSSNEFLRESVEQAKMECVAQQKLVKGAGSPKEERRGRQRITNCFKHNLDIEDDSEPLYLLLENAGTYELKKFVKTRVASDTWNMGTVQQLMKQMLEGIAYMQSFKNPWIHHDLKPLNMVVKENNDAETGAEFLTLKLIDFGGTVQHFTEGRPWCNFIPATPVYAPPEFNMRTEEPGCPAIFYAPGFPKAFDSYAFGATLLQVVLDMYVLDAVKLTIAHEPEWEDAKIRDEHGVYNWMLHRATFERENPAFWLLSKVAEAKSTMPWVQNNCIAVLNDPDALSFFEEAFKTVRILPGERPTAQQLLKEPWMSQIVSNDDPDVPTQVQTEDEEDNESWASFLARLPFVGYWVRHGQKLRDQFYMVAHKRGWFGEEGQEEEEEGVVAHKRSRADEDATAFKRKTVESPTATHHTQDVEMEVQGSTSPSARGRKILKAKRGMRDRH